MRHRDLIQDQFTRQALPFSEAPSMRDRAAIDLLLASAYAGPAHRSLDVACGPGLVALAFAKVVAYAVGLDATPAMLDRARELQRQAGLSNVEWHCGDAGRLPFGDDTFDIVTCRFAFHHVEHPATVLAEMKRVVKPDGMVVVCDGVASSDPSQASAFNEMERLRDPSTVRFLTLAELRALFDGAGLPVDAERRYRVPAELEGLMRVSFPAPDAAERVRRMVEDSVANDSLGMGTRRLDGRIVFYYPAVVLSARK